MDFLFGPFEVRFMQDGLAEVLVLAVVAGVLGSQIVLRRLAFFTHGVGTAAFPGLVLAGPLGIPAQIAGLGAGVLFTAATQRVSRSAALAHDAATAIALVGALALGIVLASDVYESGAGVDQLLFGTLIGLDSGELATTACASVAAIGLAAVFGRTWVAAGFDEDAARASGLRVSLADWALGLAIAVAVIAAIDAVGALLVSALLVVPAATVRLRTQSVRSLQLGSFALAAAEGGAGLWLAYRLDVPPGPAIAVLSGVVFAAFALSGALRQRRPGPLLDAVGP